MSFETRKDGSMFATCDSCGVVDLGADIALAEPGEPHECDPCGIKALDKLDALRRQRMLRTSQREVMGRMPEAVQALGLKGYNAEKIAVDAEIARLDAEIAALYKASPRASYFLEDRAADALELADLYRSVRAIVDAPGEPDA